MSRPFVNGPSIPKQDPEFWRKVHENCDHQFVKVDTIVDDRGRPGEIVECRKCGLRMTR